MKRFSKKQLKELSYFLAISLVWLIIGWLLRGWFTTNEFFLLQNVHSVIARDFPSDVPPVETLSLAATQGMLETLDDPNTVVIPPPASYKFEADFAGEAGNTGMVPNFRDGQLVVEFVLDDSPAQAAGVQEEDILLAVDGVQMTPATSLTEISLLLRGPVGTPVELLVQRGGHRLLLTPVRQERIIVEWEILEKNIGYINQHTFTTNAPEKFAEALTAVLASNPSAIIWDLRNNGGGSLLATREILSFFIPDGLLFKVLLKEGAEEQFTATGNALAPDIPLIVLVNEFTFSAAEIAAAVIKETERGLTIGDQTFGKGTIQNMVAVGNDHLLEYTIGSWVTADGISYQTIGLSPNISAPDNPHTSTDETIMLALDQLK